ncbi:MAG: hypothetical protein IBX46_03485 [Desulfuromonadales bacterium]|nr:hypothetical protein [Desulfuromonadales bacterium]
MIAKEFIAKWQASTLKERSASQSHFNDLCTLIGHPNPVEADPTGEHFTFERGAAKTGGGDVWADVWKKGCFAWEYKGKHKDLIAAFSQLQRYAIALENPPLLVVSDMETINIHTNFTNTVQEIHTFALEELDLPAVRKKLLWLFTEPELFRPGVTRPFPARPRTRPHPACGHPLPQGERGSEANPAVATAACRLVELRDNWLNPRDASEVELKKRTLTNLYNQRPQWLANAHAALDAAVAAAYGWPADLADDEVLARLLALNRERSGKPAVPEHDLYELGKPCCTEVRQ